MCFVGLLVFMYCPLSLNEEFFSNYIKVNRIIESI